MPDPPEPTDRDIEARLAAAAPEVWQALAAAANALTPSDEHAAWTTDPGSLPYVTYDDAVWAVLSRLSGVGAVFPFDWPGWKGRQRYPDAASIAAAPVADAARLATTLVRGERFCDGVIAEAIADGTLHAVVSRLCRWYGVERASSA